MFFLFLKAFYKNKHLTLLNILPIFILGLSIFSIFSIWYIDFDSDVNQIKDNCPVHGFIIFQYYDYKNPYRDFLEVNLSNIVKLLYQKYTDIDFNWYEVFYTDFQDIGLVIENQELKINVKPINQNGLRYNSSNFIFGSSGFYSKVLNQSNVHYNDCYLSKNYLSGELIETLKSNNKLIITSHFFNNISNTAFFSNTSCIFKSNIDQIQAKRRILSGFLSKLPSALGETQLPFFPSSFVIINKSNFSNLFLKVGEESNNSFGLFKKVNRHTGVIYFTFPSNKYENPDVNRIQREIEIVGEEIFFQIYKYLDSCFKDFTVHYYPLFSEYLKFTVSWHTDQLLMNFLLAIPLFIFVMIISRTTTDNFIKNIKNSTKIVLFRGLSVNSFMLLLLYIIGFIDLASLGSLFIFFCFLSLNIELPIEMIIRNSFWFVTPFVGMIYGFRYMTTYFFLNRYLFTQEIEAKDSYIYEELSFTNCKKKIGYLSTFISFLTGKIFFIFGFLIMLICLLILFLKDFIIYSSTLSTINSGLLILSLIALIPFLIKIMTRILLISLNFFDKRFNWFIEIYPILKYEIFSLFNQRRVLSLSILILITTFSLISIQYQIASHNETIEQMSVIGDITVLGFSDSNQSNSDINKIRNSSYIADYFTINTIDCFLPVLDGIESASDIVPHILPLRLMNFSKYISMAKLDHLDIFQSGNSLEAFNKVENDYDSSESIKVIISEKMAKLAGLEVNDKIKASFQQIINGSSFLKTSTFIVSDIGIFMPFWMGIRDYWMITSIDYLNTVGNSSYLSLIGIKVSHRTEIDILVDYIEEINPFDYTILTKKKFAIYSNYDETARFLQFEVYIFIFILFSSYVVNLNSLKLDKNRFYLRYNLLGGSQNVLKCVSIFTLLIFYLILFSLCTWPILLLSNFFNLLLNTSGFLQGTPYFMFPHHKIISLQITIFYIAFLVFYEFFVFFIRYRAISKSRFLFNKKILID